MSDLIEKVMGNIRRQRLLPLSAKAIVGVSGGIDSMVLLEILAGLAKENKWSLIVAHFNHQLREKEAEKDALFVRRRAQRLRLGFVEGTEDVRKAAKERGVSVEMAARDARHRFFVEEARKEGANRIVLAHHQDDQVELFWLRLLRGNAGEGLAGMRWMNESPYLEKRGKKIYLVRPFLNVTKQELIQFGGIQKIEHRPDSTNAVEDYDRNRVRLNILPFLEKHQPALRQTTVRSIEILSAEKEWVRQEARAWLKEQRPRFAELHRALQREIVLWQLIEARVALNYELIERLRTHPGDSVTIAPGRALELDSHGILRIKKSESISISIEQTKIDLKSRHSLRWQGVVFSWREKPGKDVGQGMSGRESFDAAMVGDVIQLRFWRAGDRFQPIGMLTAVKLQDLFVNLKVPRGVRHSRIVALAQNGEIFWVEGMRIGEQFKVTASTSKILDWRWKRLKRPGKAA